MEITIEEMMKMSKKKRKALLKRRARIQKLKFVFATIVVIAALIGAYKVITISPEVPNTNLSAEYTQLKEVHLGVQQVKHLVVLNTSTNMIEVFNIQDGEYFPMTREGHQMTYEEYQLFGSQY